MAVNGVFTYEDLYGGKSQNYYDRPTTQVSSSFISSEFFTVSNISTTTIISFVPTSNLAQVVTLTDIESTTKLNRLANIVPFNYLYWFLVILAIILILTLIIVFIFYCHTFFKNHKTQRRESLPSFYRYRTKNRRVYTHKTNQTITAAAAATVTQSAPPPPPLLLPTPPCPSKSLECLNNQLHQQHFDIIDSPQIARLDVYRKEPLSTFTSSTSNLPSIIEGRLSARSSDPPLKLDQLYESQRASMALDDELTNDSLLINMN